MSTYNYVDHDIVDLDDENENDRKNDNYGGSNPSGTYIDHDIIDLDEE
jgi:hypothetical protein